MGGGKKQKAPAAPNYEALQASDAEQNRYTAQELTRWNRPNQYDALGNSITWSQDANGNWTQRVTQDPYMQQTQSNLLQAIDRAAIGLNYQGGFNDPQMGWVFDKYNAAAGNEFYAPALDLWYADPQAGTIGNFDRTQGDKVAGDMYASAMSRLRPEQDRTKASLDLQLRQQGLQPGTEAYNRAMKNEMTSQGDVTAKLGLDSTAAGYQAARDIYNTNLAGQGQRFDQYMNQYAANLGRNQQAFDQALSTFNANADQDWKAVQAGLTSQQQLYNQALQTYSLPMERAQALSQLYAQTPRPQFEGFSGATGYNPADMTGAANASYQAKMGNYNAGQSKKNGLMGAGASLGAAYMMSDVTLKENIVPISGKAALETILRLAGYTYDWKATGERDSGVIAQQVQEVLPDLVARAQNGKLAVNYTGLVALLMEAVKYLAEAHHGSV